MRSELTPQDAGVLLAEIEAGRAAMRRAIREHRGHYHLWLWGAAWIAMPLTAQVGGDGATRYFPWICAVGGLLSFLIGFTQSRQIRRPTNRRFVAAIAMLWAFAAIFPLVLRASVDARSLYAYGCLVAMQSYVVAGLWTDSYLLWVGLLVSALILLGLFAFPAVFWWWMAGFGGGTLVLTGVYVRHVWR